MLTEKGELHRRLTLSTMSKSTLPDSGAALSCHRANDAGNFQGAKQVYSWLTAAIGSAEHNQGLPQAVPLTGGQPMKLTVTEHNLEEMKQRLQEVRKASLAATQRGDFRMVGKLTCEAAQINRCIQEAQGMILAAA